MSVIPGSVDIAIKVILTSGGPIEEMVARLERDTRGGCTQSSQHSRAAGYRQRVGVNCAFTELLEGETLRDRLEHAGHLTPLRAINCASQMLKGLAAAHENGIVHRDLEPENPFITVATPGRRPPRTSYCRHRGRS